MGTAAVVPRVLTQVEEFLDVQVPGLKVGADRPLALAPLVDRHGGVVGHLEEGHHALRLAVGALDVRAEGTNAGPVVAQAASKLRQERIVLDGTEDAVEVVGHRGQVAAGELRTQGAGVEQGRSAAHEVEGRQQLVELDRARLAVDLVDRQAHRHAHEEDLRQLDTVALVVDEVAVVQSLQAKVGELQIARRIQRLAQALKVIATQLRIEQLVLHTPEDEGTESLAVALPHLGLGGMTGSQVEVGQCLGAQLIHQQAGGDEGVVRLLLDQGARAHDQGGTHFLLGYPIVQVAQGFLEHQGSLRTLQAGTGLAGQGAHPLHVQRHHGAVEQGHVEGASVRSRFSLLPHFLGTLARSGLTVKHVGPCNLVMPFAHQGQFNLILDVLNMEGTAARGTTLERGDHRFGQRCHGFVNAHGGCRRAPLNGQEGLGHGHTDLARVKARDLAVTADHAKLTRRRQHGLDRRRGRHKGRRGLLIGAGSRSARGHHVISKRNHKTHHIVSKHIVKHYILCIDLCTSL